MVEKGYLDTNFIPWKDMDAFIEWRLNKMDLNFSELCDRGPIAVERRYRKYADRGFRTPSGKVELHSTMLERYGYDPLPIFREPFESPLIMRKLAEKYPLLLTTRRTQNYWLSRSAVARRHRLSTPQESLLRGTP